MNSKDQNDFDANLVAYQDFLADVDLVGFMDELDDLENELKEDVDGAQHVSHLKKIIRWGRLSSILGFVTAVIFPNPISALLISQGKFTRWTTVAHHVLHKGYDGFAETPKALRSQYFAKGLRRFWDWLDWIEPAAWVKEHNVLHHYRLGERFDPDVVEHNIVYIRQSRKPKIFKLIWAFLAMSQWKLLYYAPSTIKQMYSPTKKESPDLSSDRLAPFDSVFNPFTPSGRSLWLKSYIPYVLLNFLFIPSMFLLISQAAAINVFLTLLLAEIFTNLHSYLVLVPNHAGSDVYRFEGEPKDREEFCMRQILGSVNYRCGGDINDFLHGWLNYQIEHHLWPDMSMVQYQKAQPKVKALCEKYQIPYIQDSVWKRFLKLLPIILGDESMIPMSGKLKTQTETP